MESTGTPTGRAALAGAIGGVLAVMVLAAAGAMLLRILGPRLAGAAMNGGCCSEEMRSRMAKCGCGPATTVDEPAD